MDSVFQELKRARETKHLSLEDVSDATLINSTFLEAIEKGNTTVLPQTYVRAFIREYASFVGLDPAEIMTKYDLANAEAQAPPPKAPEAVPPPVPAVEQKQESGEPAQGSPLTPIISKYAFPAILLVTLGIIIWNLARTKAPVADREISTAGAVQHLTGADSTGRPPAPSAAAVPDSITLRAVVSDSAWVQITIDDQKPLQYILRPNRKIEWRAKQRFLLSTGNAGALDLTLNTKHLGAPGKRRAILRNMELSRKTLQLP